MQEEKTGEYHLTAKQYPNTILSCCTLSQYDYKKTLSMELRGKNLFPMLTYLSKLFYLADLSIAHFILFLQLPQILLQFRFHCHLSVTTITLLIAASTAEDVVTATSYITELRGLAVTKKPHHFLRSHEQA